MFGIAIDTFGLPSDRGLKPSLLRSCMCTDFTQPGAYFQRVTHASTYRQPPRRL